MHIKIKTIEFQRNGVRGEPFYAVWFTDDEKQELIAIITDVKGGCHVIDPLVPENHFRGDNYEWDIRYGVVQWYSLKYEISIERSREELNDGLHKRVW